VIYGWNHELALPAYSRPEPVVRSERARSETCFSHPVTKKFE
jgi:hypothetical protein